MEPLLSHNSDVERDALIQVAQNGLHEKDVIVKRRMPRKCKALLCCSVVLNALGCLILAFIVFTNQSYQPIMPPPPKNASKVSYASTLNMSDLSLLTYTCLGSLSVSSEVFR